MYTHTYKKCSNQVNINQNNTKILRCYLTHIALPDIMCLAMPIVLEVVYQHLEECEPTAIYTHCLWECK